jgi:hypothetical protein
MCRSYIQGTSPTHDVIGSLTPPDLLHAIVNATSCRRYMQRDMQKRDYKCTDMVEDINSGSGRRRADSIPHHVLQN